LKNREDCVGRDGWVGSEFVEIARDLGAEVEDFFALALFPGFGSGDSFGFPAFLGGFLFFAGLGEFLFTDLDESGFAIFKTTILGGQSIELFTQLVNLL